MTCNQKRRMSRADHVRASACRIERDAHCRHKRTRAKNIAEITVHCLHDCGRRIVLHTAVMKKKFCQDCEQRGGRAMTGGISNPEQNPAISHSQPAVNVTTHLNDRSITSGHLPPWKRGRFLWNERLLRQPGGG